MTSLDANLLLYCYSEASPFHEKSKNFVERMTPHTDVAVSEFVLVEFYTLLRNPAVLAKPLGAAEAVEVCAGLSSSSALDAVGFRPG